MRSDPAGRHEGKRPAAETRDREQLALELPVGSAPELPALGEWEEMVAEYATTGLRTGSHPLALLRNGLAARGALATGELGGVEHGAEVLLAGLVIARQRPATANGITFLLLEDEAGTLNVIVPTALYERSRTIVRTEPLVIVGGRLERHAAGGGQINLLARSIDALDPAHAFRAVAPPALSFTQGRRR
jgi:error-prone DNA polymerase